MFENGIRAGGDLPTYVRAAGAPQHIYCLQNAVNLFWGVGASLNVNVVRVLFVII